MSRVSSKGVTHLHVGPHGRFGVVVLGWQARPGTLRSNEPDVLH